MIVRVTVRMKMGALPWLRGLGPTAGVGDARLRRSLWETRHRHPTAGWWWWWWW